MKDKDQKLIWEAYDDETPLDQKGIMRRFNDSKAAWEDLWKRKTDTAKWGDVGVDTLTIETNMTENTDIHLYFNWLHSDRMTGILYKIHGRDDMEEGGPDDNLDDQIFNYMQNNFIGAAHDILDGPIEAIFGVKPETGAVNLPAGAPPPPYTDHKPGVILHDFQSDYVTIQTPIPRGLELLRTDEDWKNVNGFVNTRFDQMIMLHRAVLILGEEV